MAWVLYAAIVVSFAAWLTLHFVLVVRLVKRSPKRGWLALALLPLAPIYGRAEGLHATSVTWVVLLAVYLGTLLFGMV